MKNEFITALELAARWGVHEKTIRTWSRQGKAPRRMPGKKYRFKLSDVIEFENK